MTSSLHNTITRGKSKLMFATCVAFTAGIIALLGLVTFYLIKIGISSLNWEFFTSLPSGDPKNPGGHAGTKQGGADKGACGGLSAGRD